MRYDIRFCKTADGVRIAYARAGSGPPIVIPPPGASHLEIEEAAEHALGLLYEQLAEKFTVVRYDKRGTGLSERQISELTPGLLQLDLEAVVEAAGFARFAMLGNSAGGPVVIDYVAAHPERVTRLIFFGTGAQRPAVTPGIEERIALRHLDRRVAAREEVERLVPIGGTREFIRRHTEFLLRAVDLDVLDLQDRMEWHDQRPLLRDIAAPTLVIHRVDDAVPVGLGRQLAAMIPEGRFIPLEGADHIPATPEQVDEMLAPILDFLADLEPGGSANAHQGLQTVLFTDIEASTPLTQRLGDEAAQEIVRGHNTAVRGALETNGGREVKHTGDGIMASFPSAVAAVTAALQIQRDFASAEVRVRVGLNAGEPIAEDDDLFGLSVIKAARIADRAEPGQVLVSDVVRQLCEGKTFQFASLGEVSLKGFDEVVELFEVSA